jgi:murein DD-endopeptidase MepM/ murein hydrolase activator NlpD
MKKYVLTIGLILILTVAGLLISKRKMNSNQARKEEPTVINSADSNQTATNPIGLPIDQASERITKKYFGTYVTPQNSPVSPERFAGYHTGLDFETFSNEADKDVGIKAICAGKILRATHATGYGGYIVQSCMIDGKAVTVIYGHMRLGSIKPPVGTEIKSGDLIGVLGTGFSSETDGERKHLHLGIHMGSAIDIKGYVQNQKDLSGWLDPRKVLGI